MSEIGKHGILLLTASRVLSSKVTGAGEKQVDEMSKSENIVHTFNVKSFADYLKVISGFQQMAFAEQSCAKGLH